MPMPEPAQGASAHFTRLVGGLIVRAIGLSLAGAGLVLAGTLTLLAVD
jgi:hypothetical protein